MIDTYVEHRSMLRLTPYLRSSAVKIPCLLAILLGISQFALATEAPRPYIHDEDLSADRVVDAVARVRASFTPQGAQRLSGTQQSELNQILDRLVSLYQEDAKPGHSTARSLQRQANSILMPHVATNDSGNDVVCQRVVRVGTKIPSVECTTRAEREREQVAAGEAIHRFQTACSAESAQPVCVARRLDP